MLDRERWRQNSLSSICTCSRRTLYRCVSRRKTNHNAQALCTVTMQKTRNVNSLSPLSYLFFTAAYCKRESKITGTNQRQCLCVLFGAIRRCIVLGFCRFQGRKRDVRWIVGDATSNTFAIARDGGYRFTRHLYPASEQLYVLQSVADDVLDVSNRPVPPAVPLSRSNSLGSCADRYRVPSVPHLWPRVSKRAQTELSHKNQSSGPAGVRA